jgi:hypothetical protein
MTSPQSEPEEGRIDPEVEDQDAGPASQPTGAAATDGEVEEEAGDQDAGPASRPTQTPDPAGEQG